MQKLSTVLNQSQVRIILNPEWSRERGEESVLSSAVEVSAFQAVQFVFYF